MKTYQKLLGISALGVFLLGCYNSKQGVDKTALWSVPEGYTISGGVYNNGKLKGDVTWHYRKKADKTILTFYNSDKHHHLQLDDKNNDGTVDGYRFDVEKPWYGCREDTSKEKLERLDKILADYKEILNVDKVHENWKKKFEY